MKSFSQRLSGVARKNAMLHYNLGVFYIENQEYKLAVDEFEEAIAIDPKDDYAHFNLGYT